MKEFDGIKLNSIVPDEGTLFIFDICITDDPGGFNSHLADSKELNASAAIHQIVDEVVKNLGERSNSPSRKRAICPILNYLQPTPHSRPDDRATFFFL